MLLNNTSSLKRKLLVPILSFIACVYISSQALSYYTTYQQEQHHLIERVKVLAKGVAYNIEAAILFDDSITAQEILSAFAADSEIVRVKLYTMDDKLFSVYEKLGVSDEDIPTPNSIQVTEIKRSGFAIGANHIFLFVPIEVDDEIIAGLRVTISIQYLEEILVGTIYNSLFFLFVLAVAGYALYLIIQKVVIIPVAGLNEAMQGFIERKKAPDDTFSSSNDEIGQLVTCFNTMMERLVQREKQVRFTLNRLEQEKAFANEVIETVLHALLVVDEFGNIILTNGMTQEVLRCPDSTLDEMLLTRILHSNDRDLVKQSLQSKLQLDEQLILVIDEFNNERVLEISSRQLSKPGMVLLAIQDVTEAEQSIRSQRLAAGVFESSQDGLVVLNQHGIITMVNRAITNILGFRKDEMLNRKVDHVFEWQQAAKLTPAINEAVANYGQWQGEIGERHKNGALIPLFVKVSKINEDNKTGSFDMVLIYSDLSDVKEMERLEHLAYHDSLTGLPNRAQLYKILSRALEDRRLKNGEYAAIYLDLDGFKQVNDTFGHDAGDEVLKQVSKRLSAQVRDSDLVARLSGDEFVVFLTPIDRSGAERMCDRILNILSQDIPYNGNVLKVGASLGVYVGSESDSSASEVLTYADRAMYEAKVRGKRQWVVYDEDMTDATMLIE